MQRLFTTFASGWPGFGLLTQRLIIFVALLHETMASFKDIPPTGPNIPEIGATVLGIFILIGFWTPIVGGLIAAVEVCMAYFGTAHAWSSILIAVLSGTLAMIGPGAFSVDARLFGRKRLKN